ncbi:MAG: GspE/PulE family protein [Planctomycetales bacterium]
MSRNDGIPSPTFFAGCAVCALVAGPARALEADRFPPIPGGEFHRGNAPGPGEGGYYFDPWLFGAAAVLLVVWMRAVGWANAEGGKLGMRASAWNTLLVAGGLAGFLALLTRPPAAWGFLLLALFASGPFALFLLARNSAVPASGRILTPRHLKAAVVRRLARWGIPVGLFGAEHAALGSDIRLIGKSSTGRDDVDRSRQVEHSPAFVAAKELVYDAILRRATDIHLEPRENELSARIRIDGVMYPVGPFDRGRGEALVNIFKVLGGMDITDKRRAQDGSFRVELAGRSIDVRAATQGTRFGEKLTLRLLDQAQTVTRLSELGMRQQLMDEVEAIVRRPHGMLLCCGPTGAGKSTTLHAALRSLDAHQSNIITVEDPVEFSIPDVNQIEINTKAGQSFATSLRNILRQDPDVLMIGEIRDRETAEIACQAANTGHMVLSTVHANDTFTALHRMQELGTEPYVAATALSAILGQRLARRLCPDCKRAYRPDAETLKKHGLPAEKVGEFHRPPEDPQSQCPRCGGTGFYGRIGIFELLIVNDAIREMIRNAAPLTEIRAEARKNGMLSLKEEGLRHVVRGVTSLEEMLRVVQ